MSTRNKTRTDYFTNMGISVWFWEKFVVPTMHRINNNQCQECGSEENLDVHHTDYHYITINNLMLLCRSCHKKWHINNPTPKLPVFSEGIQHE